MKYIYFFYGLSFFTLGISVVFYPRKGSEFVIAKNLIYIALFGIAHGMYEWAEMFAVSFDSAEIRALNAFGLVLLPLSYFFLILFGIKSLVRDDAPLPAIQMVPAGLLILWIIMTVANTQHLLMGNIWARYLLGLPGTVLTACALFKQLPVLWKVKIAVDVNVRAAAWAFLLYGVFSGMIVPDAGFFPASVINYSLVAGLTGIPIQVFRTVCAVIIAYNIISMLSLFVWESREKLHILSIQDELTGLLNRRGFFTLVEQQIKIAKRQKCNLMLFIVDVDDLKKINDSMGHEEGDTAIIEIAAILRESFRESDIVGRIGGDEFAILHIDGPDCNLKAPADRLQTNIARHNDQARQRKYRLSMSIGMAWCASDADYSINDLMGQADGVMYEQKRNKKNRN